MCELKAEVVRVDSLTASGYFLVTEDGLFQFGHSKDHRLDLLPVTGSVRWGKSWQE